jgi:hypothetical protein
MSPRASRFPFAAGFLLAAAGLYLAFLGAHASRVAGGADSSGYLNAARGLSRGRVVEAVPLLAELGLAQRDLPAFIPLGYVPGPRPGTMAFDYPPGLPLHLAAAAAVAGWREGPFWVAPVCAIGALILIFLLGRDLGLGGAACAAAAAILAAHPAFLFEALQPMSDVPATAWALGAIFCARRSREDGSWAPAAGFAFGIAFLVRPSNILILIPCLVFLGFDGRRLTRFAAGGALPFVFFVAYNRASFGHPFQTGYGELGLWRELAWGHFAARIRHYSHWLSTTLTGLVLLGWLAVPFDRHVTRRDRAALFLWFTAFLLFYCFYKPYETWWYLRFLLPSLPALILGFLLAGRDALRFIEARFGDAASVRFASWLAIGIVLLLELRQVRRLGPRQIVDDQVDYTEAAAWARERLPSPALAVAMQMSGTLRYYTAIPIVRWDTLPPEDVRRILSAAERRGYRIFALLFPFEEDEVRTRTPGAWVKLAALRDVSVWTRAAPSETSR